MQHMWTIFNKNTHICGRSAIAIVEMDLTKIILLTHYLFYWENSQERKMIPNGGSQWEKLTIFFYSEVTLIALNNF